MARKALWTQSQPRPVKPRKPIRRRTGKRAAEERRYRARVKEWLADKKCAVFPKLKATQCHHSHGRLGKLLLYEPWWVPVSDWGHQWIGEFPKYARTLGLLCPLGQWNSPPPC